ncbi:MAG: HRDC domain-containing protein [Candidatus Ratteibacteria bacterium]
MQSKRELDKITSIVAGEKEFAADLESNSLYRYYDRICLLQISTQHHHFIIDPFLTQTLSPLIPLFEDNNIRKVFHGAGYDLQMLFSHIGCKIGNLCDTQIAAQFLGEPHTSLSALLEKKMGIRLHKKYQTENWGIRPLPPKMLHYAISDTCHLLSLANIVRGELTSLDRLSWVREECSLLTKNVTLARKKKALPRFRNKKELLPEQNLILSMLLGIREEIAQKKDLPAFRILSSDQLLAMACLTRFSEENIKKIAGRNYPLIQPQTGRIIQCASHPTTATEETFPSHPPKKRIPLSPSISKKIQSLKNWRVKKAKKLSLNHGLILTNTQIYTLATDTISDIQDILQSSLLKEWQKESFSKELFLLLSPSKKKE